MKIEILFRDSEARSLTGYLRRRYGTKQMELPRLAKRVIREFAAGQAGLEIEEILVRNREKVAHDE